MKENVSWTHVDYMGSSYKLKNLLLQNQLGNFLEEDTLQVCIFYNNTQRQKMDQLLKAERKSL